MIPQRFQANCTFCQDPIDIRRPGVYQLTYGWVKNRKEGGGNAIALAEKQPYWSCGLCMEGKLQGQARYQMDLFG
jgi:hypothetical protein